MLQGPPVTPLDLWFYIFNIRMNLRESYYKKSLCSNLVPMSDRKTAMNTVDIFRVMHMIG